MKPKKQNDLHHSNGNDEVLRRLVKAKDSALQIYELAESLYMRDAGGAARMSVADIEQINEVLRQTANDIEEMKKQFLDLATVEGSFHREKIPIGF